MIYGFKKKKIHGLQDLLIYYFIVKLLNMGKNLQMIYLIVMILDQIKMIFNKKFANRELLFFNKFHLKKIILRKLNIKINFLFPS